MVFVALGVTGILSIAIAWIYRGPSPYDPTQVHPRLAQFGASLAGYRAGILQDGGSLRIELTDDKGNMLSCLVPGHMRKTAPYTRLLLGTAGLPEQAYEEVAHPKHSFLMLQSLLHEHRSRDPHSADIALTTLRGRLRDYAGSVYRVMPRYAIAVMIVAAALSHLFILVAPYICPNISESIGFRSG